MDEITLDDKKYLSSRQAAKITGYAKDYVGQLCREGRVDARLVGRNWYVLETSILDHRFGAEEPKNAAISVPEAPASTWQAPIYTNESIRTVPELTPKPVFIAPVEPIAEETKVLSDMQSAWQEWFEQQNKAQKTLPDADEMLLEDHVEGSRASIEPEIEETVEEEESILDADETPIHIERITPAPVEAVRPQSRERTAVFTRNHEVVATAKTRPVYREEEYLSPRARRTMSRTPRGSGTIMRAVLFSIMGLVIVITVLGSGSLDTLVEKSNAQSFITDFFAGIQHIGK